MRVLDEEEPEKEVERGPSRMGGLPRRGCPGGLVKMWIRDKGVVSVVLDAADECWKVNLGFSNVEVIGDIDEYRFGGR